MSFTISFGWFCNFCNETGYLDRRGNGSDDMHLDRIDATLGYEPGNLQVLSCAENVAKGNRERMDEDYRDALAVRRGEDDWYDPDAGDISRWVRGEGEPF